MSNGEVNTLADSEEPVKVLEEFNLSFVHQTHIPDVVSHWPGDRTPSIVPRQYKLEPDFSECKISPRVEGSGQGI